MTISIQPVNDAPSIQGINPQNTNEDTSKIVSFNVSDIDSTLSCNSTHLSVSSSNNALVSPSNISFSGNVPLCSMQILPSLNQYGNSTLTVQISDGEFSRSTNFVLTVNQVGDDPTSFNWAFDVGTQSAYTFASSILDFSSGIVKLFSLDQNDSDNSSSAFGSAITQNITWDNSTESLKLRGATNCTDQNGDCQELDIWTSLPKQSSLVGYWKFNESTQDSAPGATDFRDFSANGNHASVSGSGLTFGVSGKIYNSMNSSGSAIVSTPAVDLLGASDDMTVAFWVNPAASQVAYANIIDHSHCTDLSNWTIQQDTTTNRYGFYYRINSTTWTPGAFVTLKANEWQHVVFSKNAATVRIYINGVAVNQVTEAASTILKTARPLNFMGNSSCSGRNFSGSLDDVAIWKTGLSADEVLSLHRHQSRHYNPFGLSSDWAPAWNNIVLYQPFEGNDTVSHGTLMSSSIGNHMTVTNNNTRGLAFNSGKIGTALSFDGVDDYLNISSIAPINSNNSSFTLSYWIRFSSSANNIRVISNGNYGWTNGFLNNLNNTGITAGNIGFGMGGGSQANSIFVHTPGGFNDGNWHHFVGSVDFTNKILRLYVNGRPVIPTKLGSSCGTVVGYELHYSSCTLATSAPSLGTTTIGSYNSGQTEFFQGSLDEFTVWNTSLSASQIASIYERQSPKYAGSLISRVMATDSPQAWNWLSWQSRSPIGKELPDSGNSETITHYPQTPINLLSNLVGLWHFNESSYNGTAQEVKDDSGNNYHGQRYGSVSTVAHGRFGRAADFNTGSDYIQTSFNGSHFAGDFTVSAWFNHSALNTWSAMVSNNTTTYSAFVMTMRNNTTQFGINNVGVSEAGVYVDLGADHYNKWILGVIRKSGTTVTVTAFLPDKKLSSSGTLSWTLNTSNNALLIGRHYTGGTQTHRGQIDEVAIWTRSLSDAELQHLYDRGTNRLKFQVRSCAQADCSDAQWRGPDGTSQSYFSEFNNNTDTLGGTGTVKNSAPQMTFADFPSLSVSNNRYFQYRSFFETEVPLLSVSPELRSVTVGPTHYPESAASIVTETPFSSFNLSSFSETLGANGCSASVRYNISLDKMTWYYWNGSSWISSNGSYEQANLASTLSTRAAQFSSQVGNGSVYVKAFLKSNGSSVCELDAINMGGNN